VFGFTAAYETLPTGSAMLNLSAVTTAYLQELAAFSVLTVGASGTLGGGRTDDRHYSRRLPQIYRF
jgi:hypothetical protein